jgi:dTDP-L-rhamnose 4-epimerase
MKTLITGGAGFIGTRLAKWLIKQGDKVRILDNLTPQVHSDISPEDYFPPDGCEFVFGDVRDAKVVTEALRGIEVVFHLAAQTGVGQSMYRLRDYVDCNVTGTASLLEAMIVRKEQVQRIVLASSRAVYGEGNSVCEEHGIIASGARDPDLLKLAKWDPICPRCGKPMKSVPTAEDRELKPISIYGLTKKAQEELCFSTGRAYGIPVVALRLFNVYGGGQSLRNPYTGILTFFFSAIKSGRAPEVYEDGRESRDFVHIDDVVRALVLAAQAKNVEFQSYNIGSGEPLSILEAAKLIMARMGMAGEPMVSGRWRVGDIRHCYADLTLSRRILGYEPTGRFDDGIGEFLSWAENERPLDLLEAVRDELRARGLLGGEDRR